MYYTCAMAEAMHEDAHWISNLLTEPKKETKDIFICTDLMMANKALVWKNHPLQQQSLFFMQIVQDVCLFANEDATKDFWK